MKREDGITLAVLIITIVVILILAGVSVKIGTDSLDSTRLQGFYTQLEIVQKRVDDIATTNESYVDTEGNIIYLKEAGSDLTESQKVYLQNIIQSEELGVDVTKFKYFTIENIETILELSEIEYNLFIDFDNRIIVAEDGIKIGDKTYYVLENATYFVKQDVDKNIGTIQSLSYQLTKYGKNNYKVIVTPNNTIGDVGGTGYVKYKKTTNKYWKVSNNTEMIVEELVEYNVIYVDENNNSIEKKIKVELDSDGIAKITEI